MSIKDDADEANQEEMPSGIEKKRSS